MELIPGLSTLEEAAENYFVNRIKDIYSHVKNYHENLSEFQEKHERLLSHKSDISRKIEIGELKLEIATKTTENWLREVNKLIDDEKLREMIDEMSIEGNDECCFGMLLCNCSYRYCRSVAATAKSKEIHDKLSFIPPDPVTLPVNLVDLESTPTEFLDGLKSRDEILDNILNKLLDDQVFAVGLCGMGAIGKTTLAKEAKKKAKGIFDLIAMVEITEVPNINHIQEQLTGEMGLPLNDCTTTVQKAKKMCEKLTRVKAKGSSGEKGQSGGKILIIIDNIWKSFNLGEVGIPLGQTKECCYKFLFTSRQADVCRVMGVQDNNIMPVPILKENEAKYLFRTRVGKRDDVGDYKVVEDKLLKKCGGLPLAIVATADALKGKSLPMWHRFANELNSSQHANGLHDTHTILETSYNFIQDDNKKKFFLLACVFPLGSKITIDQMMRYGIGLNLFQYVNKLSDATDLAKSWADDLRSSSLLWEDESEEYVKIHDVVRESAISFAAKDGQKMMVEAAPRWLCEETLAMYTVLSLMSSHDYTRLSGLKCDRLEMLLLQGDGMFHPQNIGGDFFRGMTNLKVLALTSMNFKESLPKSITTLKELKTLLLEGCELRDIKFVGELESLLVLSLKGSRVEELPEEIGNLGNLRLLDLRKCIIRERLSAGIITRLSRLEGLFMCDYFRGWADIEAGLCSSNTVIPAAEETRLSQASVDELNSSSYLNVLELHIPLIAQLPSRGQFVENLNKFRIFIGSIQRLLEVMPISPLGFFPQLSRVLVIRDMGFNQVLKCTWLHVLLKKTKFLGLHGIHELKHLAHELSNDGFKDLEHLEVEGCNDMHCILSTDRLIALTAFPNLESLYLSSMNNLKIICDGIATQGMFSNLQDVSLKSLTGLQTYALPIDFAHRLTSIEVEDCQNLNFIFWSNNASDSDTTTVVPSLKKLILKDLPNLYNLLGNANSSTVSDHPQVCNHMLHNKILLPSLEELHLENVPLTKLWDSPPATDGSSDSYLESVKNLKHVSIKFCDKLDSLGLPFVAPHFLQLETLNIDSCPKMNQVLTEETDGETRSYNNTLFPNLKSLALYGLDNLKSLYGGTRQLQFAALKELTLGGLPLLVSIAVSGMPMAFLNEKVQFPCLEELYMINVRNKVDEVKELWRPLVSEEFPTTLFNPVPHLKQLVLVNYRGLWLTPALFQQLSTLRLTECDTKFLFSSSSSSSLLSTGERFGFADWPEPNLESLSLDRCKLMEGLFENDIVTSMNENDVAIRKICGQLRQLDLNQLYILKPIPFHLFNNLRSLCVSHVGWKCLFTSELVAKGIGRLLPLLEEISLERCFTMKVVLDDELGAGEDVPGNDIEFPRLKRLALTSLTGARSFNSRPKSILHFPSLEELDVRDNDFESVFSGIVIAPKLRTVVLYNCRSMTTVLNAIELPSLQSFEITRCRHLQSFSSGPVEAPLLNQVTADRFEHPMEQIDRANHPINSFLGNYSRTRKLEEERRLEAKKKRKEERKVKNTQ